ncbi:MAG TPA: ATP-binding cassette domain-containing protein, partial [Puia sp.]|nr:ATP-binding cassette domain-containing protein [Puia sp.]
MIRMIRKIGRILTKEEKRRLGWLMTLDILSSVADILFLAILLFIIHFYAENASAGMLSFLPPWLTDHHSLWLIGLFFLLFSVKNLLSFSIYTAQSRFRYDVASRISQNNLLRYLEGAYNDYAYTDSAAHVLKIAQQPIEFAQFVLAGVQQGLTEWTLIGVTVIAVLLFNAQLFLLLLVLLLPPVIIVAWLTKRRLHSARVYIKSSRDTMWQHLQESIAGYVESNLYDRTPFFTERYGQAQFVLNRHLSSLQAMQGAPSRLAEIFAVFGLLALIAIGHFSGNTNSTQFVTLGAFLAAAYKIIPGIARVLNISGQMKTYEFTMNNLIPGGAATAGDGGPGAEAETPGEGRPEIVAGERQAAGRVEPIRSIECRHIGFQYDKQTLLEDCELHLRSGDFLGIQGDSGKGKTTLINIIVGFIEPGRGEVFFNGKAAGRAERKRY